MEPLLTPVTVDPAHPFPHVLNKALCLAFLLKRKRAAGQIYLGVVTVPRALPRLVLLPTKEGTVENVFLPDVDSGVRERLYHGDEMLPAAAFRVTRNSKFYLEEEESRSIMDRWTRNCTAGARARRCGWRSRRAPNQEIIERLVANFRLAPWQIFRVDGPTNLARISYLYDQAPRPDLKFQPFGRESWR